SDAQVLIDGKPATGTSSPYSVSDLAVGSHELVVQKPGFSEHRSTFNVEKGESRALPMVELASKQVDRGFAVNSMPSGADISVDGAATGKTTPAKVSGITPGVHKLQLQLAGHNPFELSILVPDTGVLQLPTAELTEASVAAATSPKAKSEREPREPREAREPREHREPKETLASIDKPRRLHAADAEPIAARPEPAPKSTGGASGMLRLNSRPWSQVFVDGRLVGNTPQMGLPLSNGNHSVRLVNAQMGLTKTFSVQIKTGQMVTKVVNLVE
ncbi:MAG TPA: PEGA domain-containing protein, partial [Polyangiales bacterium]|nr:PEGA domain-containing protein [Polyangiales bacterium]